MSDATQLIHAASAVDSRAAAALLPLVYEELRRLAAHRLAGERHEHTLQPTALVHEAWLKMAGTDERTWQGREHFFAAAAEAEWQALAIMDFVIPPSPALFVPPTWVP